MIYCCNNVVLCANYRLYNAEPWKKTATALPPIFSTNMAIFYADVFAIAAIFYMSKLKEHFAEM